MLVGAVAQQPCALLSLHPAPPALAAVYEEVLAPAVKVDRPPPQLDYDADDADENEEAQLDGQQGSPRSTVAHALEEEEDETDYAALAEETHCIALLNEQSIMSFKSAPTGLHSNWQQ